MTKDFFDAVRRSLFRGRLNQHQVDGMNKIVEYGLEHGYSRTHLAYILATAYHETAQWMQPIREGARRFGPDYSNERAIRAVTAIYNKGIIRTNYALPRGKYGHSYYGRGLIQITWLSNYKRLSEVVGVDLVKNPDAALSWCIALPLLFIGMRDGLYTGKKLPVGKTNPRFPRSLRAIVNGDVRKNGAKISRQAEHFYQALDTVYGT